MDITSLGLFAVCRTLKNSKVTNRHITRRNGHCTEDAASKSAPQNKENPGTVQTLIVSGAQLMQIKQCGVQDMLGRKWGQRPINQKIFWYAEKRTKASLKVVFTLSNLTCLDKHWQNVDKPKDKTAQTDTDNKDAWPRHCLVEVHFFGRNWQTM